MAIEFGERIRRIPAYPLAAGYDLGADVAMLASNESCFAPRPAVIAAAQDVLAGAHRYPDPSYAALRGRCRSATGLPRADRAGQRLLRHPAGRRRGAARAGRGGRLRVAGVQRVSAPGRRLGRARDRGPARRRGPPRPRRDGRGDHRRHAAGAGLQPQQPDLDRAAARGSGGVPGASAAPRVRDPR